MTYDTYKVTCLKCEGSDELKITPDNTVFYTNHTPIISSRLRADMQWGFECICGNDNRLSAKEAGDISKLVSGTPMSIKRIADSLKTPDEKQFRMVAI